MLPENLRVLAFKHFHAEPRAAYESTLRTNRYALTQQNFSNYSALMNDAMDTDLELLEEKIRQTADFCQRLREENRALRQRVAILEGDRRVLEEKIVGAQSRLEHLLRRIPE